jgi:hypothetical protein
MSNIEFQLRCDRGATSLGVRILWSANLGTEGSPVHRELYRQLQATHGVEHVWMNRYSADVEWASHTTDLTSLVKELAAVLQDPELTFLLTRQFGEGTTVQVTMPLFLR